MPSTFSAISFTRSRLALLVVACAVAVGLLMGPSVSGASAACTGNMHYIGKNLLGQSRDITCSLFGFHSSGKNGWPDFLPTYAAHFACQTLFQGKMKVSVQPKTSSFPGNVMIEKASGLDIMAPANTNTSGLTIAGAPWPY